MKLLALDIATCTGWCCGPVGGAPVFGHHRMAGMSAARVFLDYERWLDRQLEILRPDRVYAEDQFVSPRIDAVKRLYGLRAYTQALCERRRLPLYWVETRKLSLFMTGRGGGWRNSDEKKAATIAACRHLGFNPTEDNEADAISVWCFAEALTAPQVRRCAGPLYA